MHYYNSMQELIGSTPLVKLHHIGAPAGVNVFVKLELSNPGGSMKDRVGQYMITDAEKRGLLQPGGTIVEGTAGNTGLGIAFAALKRGYHVIFVVPDKFSEEKQQLMQALGAQIVHTPRSKGMLGAEAKAKELLATIPGAISLQQFHNPANPQAHYETTGLEIWEDTGGVVDFIVAGAGSGGTFSGILADPVDSTIGGGEHGDYNIEGIGNDFIADTLDMSLVDEVIKVNDDEAFGGARELARKEGIIGGSSTGAAFAAVKKLIEQKKTGNIVFIAPDRGERYFSKGLWDFEKGGEAQAL